MAGLLAPMAGVPNRRQGSAFQIASAVGVSRSSASSTTEPMVILSWRAGIIIGPPVAWTDAQ
jgi:hypothetical protein